MSTPKPGPPKPPTADPEKSTSAATTPEDPNKDGGIPMPLDEPKG